MAMARRSAIPSIPLAGSKYQDFDPKSEWKEEDQAYYLILHLPGFLKDHIRITYLHASQTIRIRGERPIGSNRWSRFDKPFLLPPNCLSDKIYGRFQHGFLTVTIPRQSLPTKPQPKPTSLIPENERQTSEDEDQNRQKEAPPSSSSSPLEDDLREHRPEVGRAEERNDKVAETEISKKTAEKQMERREKVDSDSDQNPPTEVKRKESLSDAIADESRQPNTEKEENKSPEKQKIADETPEEIPGKTTEITEKYDSAQKGKEEDSKQKLKIVSKRLEEEEEEDEDEDDKQMLINVGAALVVLLAIGAYTAFNFSFFTKSTN